MGPLVNSILRLSVLAATFVKGDPSPSPSPYPATPCEILVYKSFTDNPENRTDTQDTCPVGNGPRAFVKVLPPSNAEVPVHHQAHGMGALGSQSSSQRLREVAPTPNQAFRCLSGRGCSFAVRGFGVGVGDAIVILPRGQTKCPPELDLDGTDETKDMPAVLQASKHASLARSNGGTPEVSFAVFEVPERAIVASDSKHVLCYAPYLTTRESIVDNFSAEDFHYYAGELTIGDAMFDCNFEDGGPDGGGPDSALVDRQGDVTEEVLPCNFRNFRDRFDADLVWLLNTGTTETTATGPKGDSTPGLGGSGHYVYMDSPGYAVGASATLVSPPIVFDAGGYCVQFSYNMHGTDVSTLRALLQKVELDAPTGESHLRDFNDIDVNLLGVWGAPRWVAVGNKGDAWHLGGYEFKSGSGGTYQLVFEALAGRSEEADIALDDIKVTPGRCSNEVRHHVPRSIGQGNQALVCGEARLHSGEHAEDKSWFVEGAVSCAGRGYSMDNLKGAAMPCCVPHFGTYKLVLQDQFGDGWENSYLEFRFFNRVMRFGNDDFTHHGYDATYDLVIGTVEIVNVSKPEPNQLVVTARVARIGAYAWCGVVQAGKNGKPLKVDLAPDLIKTYGVRTAKPTATNNEEVTVTISSGLKENTEYDLYCHSEVLGETLEDGALTVEQQKQEILASRTRVSTDRDPPVLSNLSAVGNYHAIDTTFTLNEAATIWCLAMKDAGGGTGEGEDSDSDSDSDALFGPGGPLEGLGKKELTPSEENKIATFFDANGFALDVDMNNNSTKQSLEIPSLIPNTQYKVYCFGEDNASPNPNRIQPLDIISNAVVASTLMKVPSVKIVRKTTLHRGFRLTVVTDGPGKVYCAAAPLEYGTPAVREVVAVGATVDAAEPGKEASVEVKGVEPNAQYTLYCVGAADDGSGVVKFTSSPDMVLASVLATSYGKYCEEEASDTYTITSEKTPFHPITAEEEMRIRNYILSRTELGLQGVYRINLLPNKEEIYSYFDKNGPKPKRYARVRAGRCNGTVGFYEQFRVGPIDSGNGATMNYERIASPVETECAGYNPQGVFGRRRLMPATAESAEIFGNWLQKNFGYDFGSEECKTKVRDFLDHATHRNNGEKFYFSGNSTHPHQGKCMELGPIIVEEGCGSDGAECEETHNGRIWVGMKTPPGDRLPIYFIYDLPSETAAHRDEDAADWAKRIIQEKRIPEDFYHLWEVNKVWIQGQIFENLEKVAAAINNGTFDDFTAESVQQRKKFHEKKFVEHARRRLAPDPYPGAPGTAGPLPKRPTRRTGLEYRSHPEHIEAQGKRFTVTASSTEEEFTIDYAGWKFTIANDRDTSLRFSDITFQNRRVAFEMGLMEALAHYTVSERNFFFMDSWYGGLGAAARKVHKGVECPKTGLGLFWDGSVCVFEQDKARPYRAHWKSGEIRDAAPQVVLVVRQMLTVSNYDYVTDYVFHLTGMFEGTVSFTGELYAGIEVPWYSSRQQNYGVQVTGAMRFAALHAHLAAWKIDFDLGTGDNYKKNSLLLTEVIADPLRPGANKLKREFAETELQAVWAQNDTRALTYEIVDENINIFGNLGGYRVIPKAGINPLHHESALYSGPAAWAKYKALTTLHKYSELDATLPRDNKFANRPAVSIDRYVLDNENIRNGDLVTWISDGVFHVPVIEDMPQTIPEGNTLGWMVKPANLFLEDPSMDIFNAMGGGVNDPGTCAVVRSDIGEVEPSLAGMWTREPLQLGPGLIQT